MPFRKGNPAKEYESLFEAPWETTRIEKWTFDGSKIVEYPPQFAKGDAPQSIRGMSCGCDKAQEAEKIITRE